MIRKKLEIKAIPGYEPEIARWLAAMAQIRERTISLTEDLDQQTLDWTGPEGDENSIGSLLYHIALVEVSWLYYDIHLQNFPPSVEEDFPFPMAEEGRITPVSGVPIAEHLERLSRSRSVFLQELKNISLEDWHTLRSPPEDDYSVSPNWAVFHLLEHEAGHAAQISSLRKRAEKIK